MELASIAESLRTIASVLGPKFSLSLQARLMQMLREPHTSFLIECPDDTTARILMSGFQRGEKRSGGGKEPSRLKSCDACGGAGYTRTAQGYSQLLCGKCKGTGKA